MASSRIEDYLATLTTFTGSDLVVNFHTAVIAELQQISWNISREKAPFYSLGSADPRSFSRGKRGIAGSLIFGYYNRDALIEELTKDNVWRQIAPPAMFTARGNLIGSRKSQRTDFERLLSLTEFGSVARVAPEGTASNPDYDGRIRIPEQFDLIQQNTILYADQLPPFDITMTFANEYGQAAFAKIYYVDILNDSGGVSIDSLVMERPMTWIARRMSPIVEGVHGGGQGMVGYPVLKSPSSGRSNANTL